MKKILILFVVCFLSVGSFAQVPFHHYFSQAGQGGLLYRCIPMTDGGIAAAGKVTDYTTFDDDLLIMKTNASGSALWIKRVASSESEEFTDLVETSDGGVVAVGRSFSMTTFLSQAIVAKYDASGSRLWAKSYTVGGRSSGAKKIAADGSGNFYILGTVGTDGASDDYFIMKTGPAGNILSQNTYGTPDSDFPLGFLRKASGEMFICGWDNTFTGENIHLLKINADMTPAWNKLITGTAKYFAYDIKAQTNGDIVLAGRYDNSTPSYDILLFTLDDATGDQVWAKSYSAVEGNGTYAYGVTVDAGGMIAVTGAVDLSDQGTFLLKTDAAGNATGSNQCGAPGSTGLGYGIATASDGSSIVCGSFEGYNDAVVQLIRTNSSGGFPCNSSSFDLEVTAVTLPMQSLTVTAGTSLLAAQDIVLNETGFSSLGTVCTGTGIAGEAAADEFTLSPNPSDGRFTVTVPGKYANTEVTVLNTAGMEVFRGTMQAAGEISPAGTTFDLTLPAGLYLVRIGNGAGMATKKMVVK